MLTDRLARVELIKLEVDRLVLEANQHADAGDLERVAAARAEIEVLYASLLEIRREQILEDLERRLAPRPRPWWRFWR